jgi:hypothetical protein
MIDRVERGGIAVVPCCKIVASCKGHCSNFRRVVFPIYVIFRRKGGFEMDTHVYRVTQFVCTRRLLDNRRPILKSDQSGESGAKIVHAYLGK